MAGRHTEAVRPVTRVQVPDVKNPALQQAFDVLVRAITELQTQATMILSGDGSPEGVVVAPPGWLYVRRDDASGARLYVKESNTNDATGWVVK